MSKISGPLLDRIDLHIEVPAVEFKELSSEGPPGTSSEAMRETVGIARRMQIDRFQSVRKTRNNAQMSSSQLRQFCRLGPECQNILKSSVQDMGLSARAHDKILRVARTIADLEESLSIEIPHLQEAVNYRMLDRQLWT